MKRVALLRAGREHYSQIFLALKNENIDIVDVTSLNEISSMMIHIQENEIDCRVHLKGKSVGSFDQIWYLGLPLNIDVLKGHVEEKEFCEFEWYSYLISFLKLSRVDVKGIDLRIPGNPPSLGKYGSRKLLRDAGWKIPDIKYSLDQNGGNANGWESQGKSQVFTVTFTNKGWFFDEGELYAIESLPGMEALLWKTWDEIKQENRLWATLYCMVENDDYVALGLYNNLPCESEAISRIVQDALY